MNENDTRKEYFFAQVRNLLKDTGAHVDAHSGIATIGLANMWVVKVTAKNDFFALTVSEAGDFDNNLPLADNKIAGHSPSSVAVWYKLFDRAVAEIIIRTRQIKKGYGFANNDHAHTVTINARFHRFANGCIESQICGYLHGSSADAKLMYESQEFYTPWFVPLLNAQLPSFDMFMLEQEIVLHLRSLPAIRLANAILGVIHNEERSLLIRQ